MQLTTKQSVIKHDAHCGPYWMPLWIKRLLSRWFNEACAIHDQAYSDQKFPKDSIDLTFIRLMLVKADKWYKVALASIYYIGVRSKLGQKSWDRNTKLNRK